MLSVAKRQIFIIAIIALFAYPDLVKSANEKDDSCALEKFRAEWENFTTVVNPIPDLNRYSLKFLPDGLKLGKANSDEDQYSVWSTEQIFLNTKDPNNLHITGYYKLRVEPPYEFGYWLEYRFDIGRDFKRAFDCKVELIPGNSTIKEFSPVST